MARSIRCLLALTVLAVATISHAATEPKRVLLLHSFGPQFVPWVFFAGHFREELFKQLPGEIDLYDASLEGAPPKSVNYFLSAPSSGRIQCLSAISMTLAGSTLSHLIVAAVIFENFTM